VFAVLFEVHPHTEQWDAYLGYAKMLRPDLETIDGFVDNIRYRSLTQPRWIAVAVFAAKREGTCALAHPRSPP